MRPQVQTRNSNWRRSFEKAELSLHKLICRVSLTLEVQHCIMVLMIIVAECLLGNGFKREQFVGFRGSRRGATAIGRAYESE
jgi:hypothetical protein